MCFATDDKAVSLDDLRLGQKRAWFRPSHLVGVTLVLVVGFALAWLLLPGSVERFDRIGTGGPFNPGEPFHVGQKGQ